MTILLDASFIIAFDNEKDVHHKKARDLWEKIENLNFGQYFISDYIFDEIIGVSLRKTSKKGTVKLGQNIIASMPIINIDDSVFEQAWKLFEEDKNGLSFTDCTNIILLNFIDTKKIATFDKAFKEITNIEVID